MTTYFFLWKMNTNFPPPSDPKAATKMDEAFVAMLKSQLQSGVLKEINSFLQGDRGYGITGDITDEQLVGALSMWIPYVTFEVHKTFPLTKHLEIAISNLKKYSGPS